LLLAASVSYILTGFLLTTEASIALSQWLLTDRAYHDTYYVVAKGKYWLSIGVVMLFLSAVTWVQVKVGAMRHGNMTKALIWTLHLGLLFVLGLPEIFTTFSVMPRRYVDYPDYFYAFNALTNSALIVGGTAVTRSVRRAMSLCAEEVRQGWSSSSVLPSGVPWRPPFAPGA
ncbi:MAG: hypothetical protein AAF913_11410, partial [Pseudomonadota bacterium]